MLDVMWHENLESLSHIVSFSHLLMWEMRAHLISPILLDDVSAFSWPHARHEGEDGKQQLHELGD